MAVEYRAEDDTYFERRRVDNQTIELGINYYDESIHDRHSYWNIYVTVFNKRKDMYSNMDKKIITGKNPFATVITAREMFSNVEASGLFNTLPVSPLTKLTEVPFVNSTFSNQLLFLHTIFSP